MDENNAALAAGRNAEIKDIVSEILELDTDELTETSLFQEDHNADSLLSIEILAALEKRFGVVIDQAELARMVNLNGVYDVVTEAFGRVADA
jgi:acyl carrier protein